MTTYRGTSNTNARGSTNDRRRRRAWIMSKWVSDVPGLCRCYRCGVLLYNYDALPEDVACGLHTYDVMPLTIDRIIPGAAGGTYRRNNIRPACEVCNNGVDWTMASQPIPVTTAINIVFSEIPGTPEFRFVEIENDNGESVSVGEWSTDHEGTHKLRIEKI